MEVTYEDDKMAMPGGRCGWDHRYDRTFLTSPYAPDFNAHHDDRRMIIEVHSYREEGTALVANIGVTTFFHGITTTKLGRIYL